MGIFSNMSLNKKDQTQNYVSIFPVEKPIEGKIHLPGSKSVTNRALLIAGLANGTSELSGMLVSDDTKYMTQALIDLGVSIETIDETSVKVRSSGKLAAPDGPLFLGNAGTAMRFLTAAAALVQGKVVLDGDRYMQKRPVGALVKSLCEMGISASDQEGCPPVEVLGTGSFDANVLEIDGQLSSQFISAIMMMAACGDKPLEIRISGGNIGGRGYIDITTSVMASFGNQPKELGGNTWLVNPTGYKARDYTIEPDASSATYLWAAEALTKGAIDLGVSPQDMSQPDAKSYNLIASFPNLPRTIDGSQIQDSIPALSVLASFNSTPVRFVGIQNLRVKECDRIAALCKGLNAIQYDQATIEGDDLIVKGGLKRSDKSPIALIHTFDDHRIAMGFAIAGLMRNNIHILNPNCVSKTFPNFWKCFQELGIEMQFSD